MAIHLTLKEFLRRTELEELGKPLEERRHVPTITELADAVGVSRNAMSNLANDNRQRVDLDILSGVVKELKRRGFEVEVDDIFVIRENGGRRGEVAPADLAVGAAMA